MSLQAVYTAEVRKEKPDYSFKLEDIMTLFSQPKEIDEFNKLCTREPIVVYIDGIRIQIQAVQLTTDYKEETTKEEEETPKWYKKTKELKLRIYNRLAINVLLETYYAIIGHKALNSKDSLSWANSGKASIGMILLACKDCDQFLSYVMPKWHRKTSMSAIEISNALVESGVSLYCCNIPSRFGVKDDKNGWHTFQVAKGEKVSDGLGMVESISSEMMVTFSPAKGYRDSYIDVGTKILIGKNIIIDMDTKYPKFPDDSSVIITTTTVQPLSFGNNCKVMFTTDCVIKGDVMKPAITACGNFTIYSEKPVTIVLESGSLSSCIGEPTLHTSYTNRWESSPEQLLYKLFIIGHINLICKSNTPNFSMGCYGRNWFPRVLLGNKGNSSIQAPDIQEGKKRELDRYGNGHVDATPENGAPVYVMNDYSEINTTYEFI